GPRPALARRRAYRKLHLGLRGDGPFGSRRHIERGRNTIEGRQTLAEHANVLRSRTRPALAGDPHETGFAIAGLGRDALARLQPVKLETHIGPACALRCDAGNTAAFTNGFDQQFRHGAYSLSGSLCPTRGLKLTKKP